MCLCVSISTVTHSHHDPIDLDAKADEHAKPLKVVVVPPPMYDKNMENMENE